MRRLTTNAGGLILSVLLAALPFGQARAQDYPTRPVRLIVPFPAGSATDNVARVLVRELQESLGQPFVVDNRPGAQGMLGADLVAKSAPDGYTLLLAAVSFAATESTFKKPAFDAVKDFTPITRVVTTPLVLLVNSDLPAKTVPEFIEYLKARSGQVPAGYGSASSRVCIAQLESLANVKVLSVGYKGIPLAINDVLSGVLQFTFADLGNAIAQAKGGKLRPLAVTSGKRNPLVPEWPALSESLSGYDIDAWIATFGPNGLPEGIAQRVNDATAQALAKRDVQERLATQGFAPALLGPREMPAFVKAEVAKWSMLARQAGIEPE